MISPEHFKKKVESGDVDANDLVKLMNIYEVMVDMFESMSHEITAVQKRVGLYSYQGKDIANKFSKAAKNYGDWQRKYICGGDLPESFGATADVVQDILQRCILLPHIKKETVAKFATYINDINVEQGDKMIVKFE